MQPRDANKRFTVVIVDAAGDSIKLIGNATQLDDIGHALNKAGAMWDPNKSTWTLAKEEK
jgi:hypothetical protein